MQDEVNEKCVVISIDAAKVTAEVLAKAISKLSKDVFTDGKPDGRSDIENSYKGQISVEELCKDNGEISNIEITEKKAQSQILCDG